MSDQHDRSAPVFSILLPSRNRLHLLKYAIASIVSQGARDAEIIVADNASNDDYAGYLEELRDAAVTYARCEAAISVTANWNRALDLARGDYVIMLGDDDALAPNLLANLRQLIQQFDRPDVIYMKAYHYAYPGMFEQSPSGYFCEVNNTPLFDMSTQPYRLERDEARRLAEHAFRFRHDISFNAQHYVWRRDFMRSISQPTGFFQSPYPDYYASCVTFLVADRIVVVPSPHIIVGISKSSFGFFYFNNREAEGSREFLTDAGTEAGLSGGDADVVDALRFPGSVHYRNWLIAVLFAKRALPTDFGLQIDLRRYRWIQLLDLTYQVGYCASPDGQTIREQIVALRRRDRWIARALLCLFGVMKRISLISRRFVQRRVAALADIYHPATVVFHDIGRHETILDAYHWLESDESHDRPPAIRRPLYRRIAGKLRRLLKGHR